MFNVITDIHDIILEHYLHSSGYSWKFFSLSLSVFHILVLSLMPSSFEATVFSIPYRMSFLFVFIILVFLSFSSFSFYFIFSFLAHSSLESLIFFLLLLFLSFFLSASCVFCIHILKYHTEHGFFSCNIEVALVISSLYHFYPRDSFCLCLFRIKSTNVAALS